MEGPGRSQWKAWYMGLLAFPSLLKQQNVMDIRNQNQCSAPKQNPSTFSVDQNQLTTILGNFALVKQKYSILRDVTDGQLFTLVPRVQQDGLHILRTQKRRSESVAIDSLTSALDSFELPRGWADFLSTLTQPLLDGLSQGVPVELLVNHIADPYLGLVLKLVFIYSIFSKRGEKDSETSIMTRNDTFNMVDTDDYLVTLALKAEEVLNILEIMPKLRNGGTRLFPRLLDCISTLVA